MWLQNPLARVALGVIPMALSLLVHESAHAAAATRLGDPTAKEAGRLTLNPLDHLDVVGSLLVPAFTSLLWGFALIGWARPTPIRARLLVRPRGRPRIALLFAAAAGPLANLAMCLAAGVVLVALHRTGAYGLNPFESEALVPLFVSRMYAVNLSLAVFHALPLPPLDGGRLLPASLGVVRALERFGWLVLVAIAVLPPLSALFVFLPLNVLLDRLTALLGLPRFPG